MGTGLEIGLLAAGLVTSLVGAGVSYYSTQQAAKTQSAIADYNFQQQQDAIRQQRESTIRALELQTSQLALDQQIKAIEKTNLATQRSTLDFQQQLNDKSLELKKKQIDQQREIYRSNKENAATEAARIALENIEKTRRSQKEEEDTISRQRATYAAAGVLMEGTPLAVLGETAALFSLQRSDETYISRLQYEGRLQEARAIGLDLAGLDLDEQMLDLQGQLDRSQVNLDKAGLDIASAGLDIQNTQIGLQKTLLDLDQYSTQAQFRLSNRQNEIDRMAGKASAAGTRTAGYASLFSNVGGALSSGASAYNAISGGTRSNAARDWRSNAISNTPTLTR